MEVSFAMIALEMSKGRKLKIEMIKKTGKLG